MNKEKYVFFQLISFLNEDKFRRIVNKYHGKSLYKAFRIKVIALIRYKNAG